MKPSDCLQLIRQHFPQIRWKKHRFFHHGWDHMTVMLDEKLIFRFPRRGECEESFQIELELLKKLKDQVRISVPDYVFVSKHKRFGGYYKIPGIRLSPGRFKKLGQKHQRTIARQIASFLNVLHAYPLTKIKKLPLKNAWSFGRSLVDVKKNYKKIRPRFKQKERKIFEKYIRCFSACRHEFRPRLVHQDLSHEHIYFDPTKKKVSGIIDFGDIHQGDPAIDFSGFWAYGEEFIDWVLEDYQFNDPNLKKRSLDWYQINIFDLLYYRITMKRLKYYKNGYQIIAQELKNA